jgi:hypothetical protein
MLTLPKLPYILYQIYRYSIVSRDAEEGEPGYPQKIEEWGKPEEVGIVLMDVNPTELRYDYGSKKTYHAGSGDYNTVVDRGGLAPVKISFSGTFGQRWINRGIKAMDGFGRLKEFRMLFETSQSVNNMNEGENIDNEKYVYGLNFFDFTMHYWASVDLDRFSILANARQHTKLPSYNVQMTGMGKLNDDVETNDPILRNLLIYKAIQEQFDEWNIEIENFLAENEIMTYLNEIVVDLQQMEEALAIVGQLANSYNGAISSLPGVNALTSLPGGIGNVASGILGIPSSGLKKLLSFKDLL